MYLKSVVATCVATTPTCKSWKRDSNPHFGIGISLLNSAVKFHVPTEIILFATCPNPLDDSSLKSAIEILASKS